MSGPDWSRYARDALAEDRASEDATTGLLGAAARRQATGHLRSEDRCVIAGLPLFEATFRALSDVRRFDVLVDEGKTAAKGDTIATVSAAAGTLLGAERVALNYIQRLSGIATVTRQAVDAVLGTQTTITDTRKTTPGLRDLEKYAVRVGGGVNHRRSLADAVLFKDNHWALLRASGMSLADALATAPSGVPIQVEVETEEQLREALDANVKFLLIDNQTPSTVRRWRDRAGPGVVVEASGGIHPGNVADYAQAGAHRVAMGALTHSAAAISMRFDIELAPSGPEG